ncbi:MAG: ABC transporter ATP-binding protein [Candidatus Puniceispirillales bacterium]
MLEVRAVSKSFAGVPAVEDISIAVRENEYVTLLGSSGCGKSVLLRIIAGLLAPDQGEVLLNGENITNLPCHERRIGFVQQKYALFPHLNVFDNIAFGLRHRAVDPIKNESIIRKKVGDTIALVGLIGQENKMTGQISGGQKQRVSLARTLVTEPKICLLDEPLGALDANLRERMTLELQNIRRELGVSFMHVTGNEFEALAMGQNMLVMSEGRIVQQGVPQEMYAKPLDIVTAKSMHNFNIFSGDDLVGQMEAGTTDKLSAAKMKKAGYCAIPMDKIDIATPSKKSSGLTAEFLTSEFLGNKIIYFFKLADGHVCEVEDHMSLRERRELKANATYALNWKSKDILYYDENKQLLS